jgi:hypothetical protein
MLKLFLANGFLISHQVCGAIYSTMICLQKKKSVIRYERIKHSLVMRCIQDIIAAGNSNIHYLYQFTIYLTPDCHIHVKGKDIRVTGRGGP